jgi:hypothetical protein
VTDVATTVSTVSVSVRRNWCHAEHRAVRVRNIGNLKSGGHGFEER